MSTVLIVDDSLDLVNLYSQVLKLNGIKSETASNGQEALDFIKKGQPFEAIILDEQMPVMSGKEFLFHYFADPNLKKVPIIFLSGDPSIKEIIKDYTISIFLRKPPRLDEFITAVKKVLA